MIAFRKYLRVQYNIHYVIINFTSDIIPMVIFQPQLPVMNSD